MNHDAIRKRLAALCEIITPEDNLVSVVMPDGTRQRISAAEWWDHRREWKLSSFDEQDNRGGLVVFLVLADLADEGIDKAKANGDAAEVERLTKERDEMLNLYFGDGEA